MKKVGRNDPCPCGSGKKYKKCCEERLGPKKKFQASLLTEKTSLQGKASQISLNFFNKPLLPPAEPRKPEEDEAKHPPEAERPM